MGQYGADISTPSTVEQWTDMRSNHAVEFGAVRCFEQVNVVDPNCLTSLHHARTAGIADMSVYHFPTMQVSAASQTATSISSLAAGGATVDRYWLDVERGNWSSNTSQNANFIAEWVQAAENELAQHPQLQCQGVGIYTRASDWNEITGGASGFGHLPLWWIMILNSPSGPGSFDDFRPFAGWTEATMVQWTIDQRSGAGLGYDGNWRPGTPTPHASSASAGDDYTVQPGDTLESVAKRFGTTIAEIAHLNNIINPADLTAGRVIRVR